MPTTVIVYVSPGADGDTLNVATKMAPALVITQKGDETSTVAGFDEIEHAPASNAENPVVGDLRETSVPAGPVIAVVIVGAPAAESTVKVPAEKGLGPVVASTILISPARVGVAEDPTTNPAVSMPLASIVQVSLTTSTKSTSKL